MVASKPNIRLSESEVASLLQAARERLHYNAETGDVTRVGGRLPGRRPTANWHGYPQICLLGRNWPVHRICWLLHFGEWPDGPVDHINRDKGDLRIANLRAASATDNARNRRPHARNKVGFKGVSSPPTTRRFYATITVDRQRIELGSFESAIEAARAYDDAAIKHHGAYACTNASLGLLAPEGAS